MKLYSKRDADLYGRPRTSYYKDKSYSVFHREDGPAIEYDNGTKHWFINGRHHREDGPASEFYSGTKMWYKNGMRHREDGPAIEESDGMKYLD